MASWALFREPSSQETIARELLQARGWHCSFELWLSSLELLKYLLQDYHGIQHKNAKHEIEGGDRRLFLRLCLFVLEKLK
jgi:hypothetical protein